MDSDLLWALSETLLLVLNDDYRKNLEKPPCVSIRPGVYCFGAEGQNGTTALARSGNNLWRDDYEISKDPYFGPVHHPPDDGRSTICIRSGCPCPLGHHQPHHAWRNI